MCAAKEELLSVISRIKRNEEIPVPKSKCAAQLIRLLEEQNYLVTKKQGNTLKITKKTLRHIEGLSKFVTVKKREIEDMIKVFLPVNSTSGIVILTTNNGLVTHKDADRKSIGGRIVAFCY